MVQFVFVAEKKSHHSYLLKQSFPNVKYQFATHSHQLWHIRNESWKNSLCLKLSGHLSSQPGIFDNLVISF